MLSFAVVIVSHHARKINLTFPPSLVQVRSHITVIGMAAVGNLHGRMNSRAITASTLATGLSSATCVSAPSPGQIIWLCT